MIYLNKLNKYMHQNEQYRHPLRNNKLIGVTNYTIVPAPARRWNEIVIKIISSERML